MDRLPPIELHPVAHDDSNVHAALRRAASHSPELAERLRDGRGVVVIELRGFNARTMARVQFGQRSGPLHCEAMRAVWGQIVRGELPCFEEESPDTGRTWYIPIADESVLRASDRLPINEVWPITLGSLQ